MRYAIRFHQLVTLVELIAVNPTICEFAGLPQQERIDALSIGPVLRGEQDAHRDSAVSAIRNFRCLRTSRYKYIENCNDTAELYDLQEDPNEQHNVAKDLPQVVRELSGTLRQRDMEGMWCR